MRQDVSNREEASSDAAQSSSPTWASRLRDSGLRVTKQRLAVLNALDEQSHSTADEVLYTVRASLPEITVQSVYTVLKSLNDVSLVRKLDLPDSPSRYETRAADNHHHAVCTRCGHIEDIACTVGDAPCLTPSETNGMTILSADVVFRGICQDCRNAA